MQSTGVQHGPGTGVQHWSTAPGHSTEALNTAPSTTHSTAPSIVCSTVPSCCRLRPPPAAAWSMMMERTSTSSARPVTSHSDRPVAGRELSPLQLNADTETHAMLQFWLCWVLFCPPPRHTNTHTRARARACTAWTGWGACLDYFPRAMSEVFMLAHSAGWLVGKCVVCVHLPGVLCRGTPWPWVPCA